MEDNPGDVTAKVEEHYAQLSKEVVLMMIVMMMMMMMMMMR